MEESETEHASESGGLFRDVPVVLTVSVGRARTQIGKLLSLDRNAVIPLESGIDDPVTIYAGERLVAYGELQEMEGEPRGRLAVRVTRLADSSEAD